MKNYGILLLSFVLMYITGNAQVFSPIAGTGFNYDVVASGSGTGASLVDKTIMPNISFYSKDFVSTLNTTPVPLGLPANGIINSAYRTEVTYQLGDYNKPNVIFIGLDSDNHRFTLKTPTAYTTLSVLMTNNYSSSVCVEVNFEDTTRTFYNFNTKAWDGANAAYAGCGVVNINNNDQYGGTALTYNLFDYVLTLSETDRVKKITSIRFSKSDIGTMLYVFAVSGSNNSTYTGIAPTKVLEGNVTVDAPVRYTDTGGEIFCYANGTTQKVIFTPADTTKQIRLKFDYFTTYCHFDVMKIYNGKEVDEKKLIAQYFLSITNDQKEVIATNPDGALTCVYSTNAFYPHLGWSALVTQIALNDSDLKAIEVNVPSLTPPNNDTIQLALKVRNYSLKEIKGSDYSIRFTDADSNQIATAKGVDIAPGIIDTISVPVLFATNKTVKGEIIYAADQNTLDNITAPIVITPLPQIKMSNGIVTVENKLYNFYDEGGINLNYYPNKSLKLTVKPNDLNKAVRVRFGMFNLERGYDTLKIFNGDGVGSDSLLGVFSTDDEILPLKLKEIKSTSNSGALTFVFTSDVGMNKKGWEALIDVVDIVPVVIPEPQILPGVTTQIMSDITATTATGHCTLTGLGNPSPSNMGICYSNVNAVPTILDSKVEVSKTFALGAFDIAITGLKSGVNYYARAYVTNAAGTSYGVVVSFTTLSLVVSDLSLEIGAKLNDTTNVLITSNATWTAVCNVSWLKVNLLSGTGNAQLTFTATANPAVTTRTATVTISAVGLSPQIITITQKEGAAILLVSETSANFDAKGGSVVIDVTSNTGWSAISEDDWLKIEDTKSISGDIVLNAEINPTAVMRSTTVKISTDNGGKVETVLVSQAGAANLSTQISNNKREMTVYPNPCSEGFTIEAGSEQQLITITDLTGRVVLNREISGTTFITTLDFNSGVYIIRVGEMIMKLQVR